MHTVRIDAGFEAFRDAARSLLAQNLAPDAVTWVEGDALGGLFDSPGASSLARTCAPGLPGETADGAAQVDAGPPAFEQEGGAERQPDSSSAPVTAAKRFYRRAPETPETPETPQARGPVRVSRDLLTQLETAARCRVGDRWALLYRVLWRWTHGERAVLSPADADGARLAQMNRQVRHALHRMHAFVRFRERAPDEGEPRFVAWYEPEHDVLDLCAEHFADRMGASSWMIATPEGAVCWDGRMLHRQAAPSPGSIHPDGASDVAQDLWLAYYAHTFNPARVNAGLTASHMPVRFWHLMPETRLIPQLVSEAGRGARRVGESSAIRRELGAPLAIRAERAMPVRAAPHSLDSCRRCPLWQRATQAVPGVGAAHARIMVVGEQPGDQEDLSGKAFVGPAGQLLDRAFDEAGVVRGDVWLTNAVKHFKWEPRGKRRLHKTPAQREIAACAHWLDEEIEQVGPRVIVALGATALQALTGLPRGASGGPKAPFQAGARWIVPTFHPAYALRAAEDAVRQQAYARIVAALAEARRLSCATQASDFTQK